MSDHYRPCCRDEADCDWYRDEWRRLARENEALQLTDSDKRALDFVRGSIMHSVFSNKDSEDRWERARQTIDKLIGDAPLGRDE